MEMTREQEAKNLIAEHGADKVKAALIQVLEEDSNTKKGKDICEIEDCGDVVSPETGLCPHHLRCHRQDGEIEDMREGDDDYRFSCSKD